MLPGIEREVCSAKMDVFFAAQSTQSQGVPNIEIGGQGGLGGPSAFCRMDVYFADTGIEALVFHTPTWRFQKGFYC